MRLSHSLITRLCRMISVSLPSALLLAIDSSCAAGQKPKLLLLITDDQRYKSRLVVKAEHGEKGRFPWIPTPHVDRLAHEDWRSQNAFVVYSLPYPWRASIPTGNYRYRNGVVNEKTLFSPNSVTLATLLPSRLESRWDLAAPDRSPSEPLSSIAGFLFPITANSNFVQVRNRKERGLP